MGNVVNFCDYFVLSSGNTDRHVKAIADGIEEGLKDVGIRVTLKEGHKQSDWIILDIGDIIVHVFQKDLREFYGLEYLWQEAKKVKWESKPKKK
jgi:ribosome-associated protein